MGILQTIFGSKKGASADWLATISDVEAALARLDRERHAAKAMIADAASKRRELLLTATDQEIDAIDRGADAGRLTLERLEILEPQLLERLASLQSDARRALLAEFEGAYEIRAAALDKAMGALLTVFEDYQALVGQISAAGFEIELRSFVTATPLLNGGLAVTPETVELFRRARETLADRRAAAETRRAAPPATPAQARYKSPPFIVHPLTPRPKIEHRVSEAPLPEYRPSPRRAPIKAEGKTPFGFMKITVLRHGFEIEGKPRVIGDEIVLPNAEADKWLRTGGCEVVERGEIGSEAAE